VIGISAPFIQRPIGTVLLAVGLLIAGIVAYDFLPVAPLPSVDIPTIVVFANRPGADPETMASSIASPLERRLGEIPGVTEITSISAVGSASIVIQFDIDRPIEGAAHDVQAAINAATSDLPSDLPTRPFYRKFNPAQAPIMTLSLTSQTLSPAQVYDAADTVLGQRLSQLDGVSQVSINGAEKPAVRVQLNPAAVHAAGLSAQDVYTAIRNANITEATGSFEGANRAEYIAINGQMNKAADYRGIVIKSVNGAAIRLRDVADVVDSVANVRLAAWENRTPAILLSISKVAGANVIATDDRIKAELPRLMRWLPPDIHVTVVSDGTTTIRASVNGIRGSLVSSIALVLLVVLIFMRRTVPTLAAAATVPLSIGGTLAAMWLLGYSLDNFSLMALTISVGFVVDDAIVMIENIARHVEMGKSKLQAAFDGARQIGFTVVSISISLVAVFIPITFMGGLLGRIFHEFAMVLTVAISLSALVSLTLTPMICGRFAVPPLPRIGVLHAIDGMIERSLADMLAFYARTLDWSLRHTRLMLLVTLGAFVGTIMLYRAVPKGFLPLQDTGLIQGGTVADPSVSFAAMAARQQRVVDAILTDPAVASVASVIGITSGWSSLNRGQLTVQLKPPDQRRVTSEQVIDRLRPTLRAMPDVQTFLFAAQDLRGGGRSGGSQFQFVLLDQDLPELRLWTARLETALGQAGGGVTDVTSDQDRPGPQTSVVINRDTAYRLGLSTTAIDNALTNAFSQRQISTIYSDRNQYSVVLEVDPHLQKDPSMLDGVFVGAPNAQQVPLSAVAHWARTTTPLAVRHQGQFPATSISFNLAPGMALGDAIALVQRTAAGLRMPETVKTQFAGNAQFLQKSLSSEPYLIGAALLTIYIILGVLYESLIHPLTILSTLPSAGLGALLAVVVTGGELSPLTIIGILLLIGIVKKNGIMLVDFALEAERDLGLRPQQAIHLACMERFRPIMMTTLAALLGAVPLALGSGVGSEYQRPLGVVIIGGLVVSQALTLYTTPVVYLALERLARGQRRLAAMPAE
jgi:multidrug efflux pump